MLGSPLWRPREGINTRPLNGKFSCNIVKRSTYRILSEKALMVSKFVDHLVVKKFHLRKTSTNLSTVYQ